MHHADELAGWTQRMTATLEKLREAQEPKRKSDAAADAPDAPNAPNAPDTSKGLVADPVAAKQATAANAAPAALDTLNADNGGVAHNTGGAEAAGLAATALLPSLSPMSQGISPIPLPA